MQLGNILRSDDRHEFSNSSVHEPQYDMGSLELPPSRDRSLAVIGKAGLS